MTHPHHPDVSFDGGDLDCGNGLLLLIRKHIDPLEKGQLLEILSVDSTVEVDLPAWCRLTGNELVSIHRGVLKDGVRELPQWSFLVSKGAFEQPAGQAAPPTTPAMPPQGPAAQGTGRTKTRKKPQMEIVQEVVEPVIPETLPAPAPAPTIEPLSVVNLGSWPRPPWLLRALHEHLEGRMSDADFQATADDAVRLAVAAQVRAGTDVVSDGEMRRDNYSSFVGGLLDNCQLIPITDLLPYVDDPAEFERELRALDVPAGDIRHPAVFGRLGRSRPLAEHEARFAMTLTDRAVKVDLPGPYLLTRTMWMECVSDRAYDNREDLARDIVRVLREEIHHLLAAGVAMIQIDEPVLTEVLYGEVGEGGRTFMCGALGERSGTNEELAFARDLLQEVTAGLPAERLAVHVCRGNWTPDESKALSGDYEPLTPLLASLNVHTLMLELCTPRAGELDALAGVRDDQRIGVGVFNQKNPRSETFEAVLGRAEEAISTFGRERVLINTDCGFATFADNPILAAQEAEDALVMLARVRDHLRA
ncbi:MAG TPA: 5-methyltetrahydropteroyltriglutamate--homocysteine methyltransferase [Propionibacterium sp.]|jgi:5-methyltetrahydropteroyltriglutamate--homocysteine methyltransferase|nr:5-methyltetrahydropteroyltriglutamate--homocysteine methyltransferase [Propionibacterium sp.]